MVKVENKAKNRLAMKIPNNIPFLLVIIQFTKVMYIFSIVEESSDSVNTGRLDRKSMKPVNPISFILPLRSGILEKYQKRDEPVIIKTI